MAQQLQTAGPKISLDFLCPNGQKNWSSLKDFYRALEKRSPYIGVEQFTLRPNTANRGQLDLVLRVSSVEITKSR